MRLVVTLLASALISSCGTRPPLPPECEGPLTPINAATGTTLPGAVNESQRRY
ncbi:hypothetical protein ABIC42_006981 [Variovorax sp. 1133]